MFVDNRLYRLFVRPRRLLSLISKKSHGIGKCNPDDQMSGLRPQDSRILGIQDFRFGFHNPDLDHHPARRTWPASKKASKAFDERPQRATCKPVSCPSWWHEYDARTPTWRSSHYSFFVKELKWNLQKFCVYNEIMQTQIKLIQLINRRPAKQKLVLEHCCVSQDMSLHCFVVNRYTDNFMFVLSLRY